IVGDRHVHSARVAVRGERVLHRIGGLLHTMSNRSGGLFRSPGGRTRNVLGGVNLRNRVRNQTSEDDQKKCFHSTLRIDPQRRRVCLFLKRFSQAPQPLNLFSPTTAALLRPKTEKPPR